MAANIAGKNGWLDIPVNVSAAAVTGVACFINNLSLSGAFVKSDYDLRLHSLIDVRIELPATTTRLTVVKAHVARKLQEGVGIEWCEFAPTIVKDCCGHRRFGSLFEAQHPWKGTLFLLLQGLFDSIK